MSGKRISIPVFVASILIACLVTFQVTAVITSGIYRNEKAAEAGTSAESGVPSEDGKTADGDFVSRASEKLSEIDSEFRRLYIGELDDDLLLKGVIAGYIYATGDPYADYYDSEGYEEYIDEMTGSGDGIGISVIYNSAVGGLEVVSVFHDSPADGSGLRIGDVIVYVGEEKESVTDLGYYVALSKLRGKAGTEAVFTVERSGGEEIDMRITRGEYVNLNVLSRVYSEDSSVGVVRILGFDGGTPEQMKAAFEELLGKGCDKIVIDLRYNPGGELRSVVGSLDYLLPEGPIIRIFDKDDKLVEQYDSDADCVSVPMAVVVNGMTASAAELFTAALRDYGLAKVVGTTTYGKGCMQLTEGLSDGDALSVTYRLFKPPFSESYHEVGIVPDIEEELDEEAAEKNIYKITDEEDNQLAAAVASFYAD